MLRPQRSWAPPAVGVAVAVALAIVIGVDSSRRAAGPEGSATPTAVAAGSASATPTTTLTPAPDPPPAVCDSPELRGPSSPPDGAVVVPTSEHLGRLTEASPPGTTFWLAPGRHLLDDGEYDQVVPKAGNRYVGAPGAVLDGRRLNRYAFTGQAADVHIEHLTIEHFGRPGTNSDEAVVNHDAGPGWVLAHLTVRENAGAGVMLGDGTVVEDSCLADNGQYGFNAYSPDGVRDVTFRDNEVTGNNTDDWERRRQGCGCTGGGKFWETRGATITGNAIHDNRGVGLWADTNNAGFLIRGNHFADNDDSAIVFETSYNAAITGNTFVRNALRAWRDAPGFPVAAVYVSESGSDERVDTAHRSTFEVAGNLFVDNWGGVVAWENADRFAGSPANTSTDATTLVNPRATLARCRTPDVIRRTPYVDDCRWKTQHLRVHDNTFVFSPEEVGPECTAANLCGSSALLANYGSYPDWSPYLGPGVQQAVALHQDNLWFDNTYRGPWRFLVVDQSTTVSFSEWQGAPYGQDRGSTIG
ncbi:right-handed parallel beta-helix repeat-containing protein [Fodinibacter luteus]|uniref:Right-handed parallel beta-helix repeat-containing protein n=1 Tax=Fodinibacter luteus TaxID=552064 RepID=A0ABP8JWE5_9MICO